MKQLSVMFFVLGLAIAAVPSAVAQLFVIPTTRVRVVNLTSDGSMVTANLDENKSMPFSVGSHFEKAFQEPGFGIGSRAITYQITACPATDISSHSILDDLPAFATDPHYLGADAISWDFLNSDPSKDALEAEIGRIEKVIASRNEPAYKDTRITPLKEWLKRVEKVGYVRVAGSSCRISLRSGTLASALDITNYNSWPVIQINITGSMGNYHSAIVRAW